MVPFFYSTFNVFVTIIVIVLDLKYVQVVLSLSNKGNVV